MRFQKGLVQIKQSPVITSPEFPATKGSARPFVLPGSSWTFNVPAGWSYNLSASAPVQRQSLPLLPPGSGLLPANVTFTVDAIRSMRNVRSDGSMDVTVAGDWMEFFPPAPEDVTFVPIPTGTYSAVIIATLYPSDNPPPSA